MTLDTAAYEALYQKRADFMITFSAWEGVEAEAARDRHLRTSSSPTTGSRTTTRSSSPATGDWLAAEPGARAKRSSARRSGASSSRPTDPDEAAADPRSPRTRACSTQPGPAPSRALPRRARRLLVDAAGRSGTQTLEQWTGYSAFLYDQGLLADADGKPLAAPPDYASLFTNDFLP